MSTMAARPSPTTVTVLLVGVMAMIFGSAHAGPIQVRAEQNSNTSFHVGPEARTTFELIEEYHPLSTAFNQQHRPRAMSSSLNKGPARRPPSPSSAQILVDFGGSETAGKRPDRLRALNSAPIDSTAPSDVTVESSRWLEWTRWSACTNGKRIRIRQCLEVAGVRCEGESIQRQTCYDTHQTQQVPVARDPLVIEKEILGVEEPLLAARRRA